MQETIPLEDRELLYQEGAQPWIESGLPFPGYRVLHAHQAKIVKKEGGKSQVFLDSAVRDEPPEVLTELQEGLLTGRVKIALKAPFLEYSHLIYEKVDGVTRSYGVRLTTQNPEGETKSEEYEPGTVRDMLKKAQRTPPNKIAEEMRVIKRKRSPEFTVEQEERIIETISVRMGKKVNPTLAEWILERVEIECARLDKEGKEKEGE